MMDHVKDYVACVKDQAKEGCDVIMNPPKKSEAKKIAKAQGRWSKMIKPVIYYRWAIDEFLFLFDANMLKLSKQVSLHIKERFVPNYSS